MLPAVLHAGDSLTVGSFSMSIKGTGKFSGNDLYSPEVVCFCDIPVEDFAIHMRKYSHLGLSFPKSFLVKYDANPVFYIAEDSTDRDPSVHGRRLRKSRVRRDESFNAFLETYRKVFNELFQWVSLNGPHRNEIPLSLVRTLEEAMMMRSFLDRLFSYFKFFDSRLSEASNENFYMEREWRVRGTLQFTLDDVRRVIVPAAYSRRFRDDLPQFYGEVTFSG